MTLKELSIYYKLHKRLEQNKQMLSSLYVAAGLGAQKITGMPRPFVTSDPVNSLVIEIENLKERISRLEAECVQEKKKLEGYIATIEDDQIRMIFHLRFLRCMTWKKVAVSIGGRNTEKGVKCICYRYIKKLQRGEAL